VRGGPGVWSSNPLVLVYFLVYPMHIPRPNPRVQNILLEGFRVPHENLEAGFGRQSERSGCTVAARVMNRHCPACGLHPSHAGLRCSALTNGLGFWGSHLAKLPRSEALQRRGEGMVVGVRGGQQTIDELLDGRRLQCGRKPTASPPSGQSPFETSRYDSSSMLRGRDRGVEHGLHPTHEGAYAHPATVTNDRSFRGERTGARQPHQGSGQPYVTAVNTPAHGQHTPQPHAVCSVPHAAVAARPHGS